MFVQQQLIRSMKNIHKPQFTSVITTFWAECSVWLSVKWRDIIHSCHEWIISRNTRVSWISNKQFYYFTTAHTFGLPIEFTTKMASWDQKSCIHARISLRSPWKERHRETYVTAQNFGSAVSVILSQFRIFQSTLTQLIQVFFVLRDQSPETDRLSRFINAYLFLAVTFVESPR